MSGLWLNLKSLNVNFFWNIERILLPYFRRLCYLRIRARSMIAWLAGLKFPLVYEIDIHIFFLLELWFLNLNFVSKPTFINCLPAQRKFFFLRFWFHYSRPRRTFLTTKSLSLFWLLLAWWLLGAGSILEILTLHNDSLAWESLWLLCQTLSHFIFMGQIGLILPFKASINPHGLSTRLINLHARVFFSSTLSLCHLPQNLNLILCFFTFEMP